jgi:hypothetical protein
VRVEMSKFIPHKINKGNEKIISIKANKPRIVYTSSDGT